MARFFGTVQGGRGRATRLGHQDLDVTAQSYSGSIIVKLWKSGDNEDYCRIAIATGSACGGGYELYAGPIKNLFSDQTNFGR